MVLHLKRISYLRVFGIRKFHNHGTMSSKIRIGTHNGTFHCDEVLACTLLKYVNTQYAKAEIVRSRDMNILKDCDIVVDVGGVYDPTCHRYDHHQRSFSHTMNSLNPEYPWDIKLSSAGLVYYHFGHEIISNILKIPANSDKAKIIFCKMYENFIQEIDAIDNGISMCADGNPRYTIHTNLSMRVRNLNPSWNETNPDETKCFELASDIVNHDFLNRVIFYNKVWLPARNVVEEAILNRMSVHSSGEIIEFKNGACPWKEHFFELEEKLKIDKAIKYAIYTDNNGLWRIQCVSQSPHSFENRLSLCESWRGLRDEELSQITGIPNCTFVHSSGFIGGCRTREGVLQMAEISLNSK